MDPRIDIPLAFLERYRNELSKATGQPLNGYQWLAFIGLHEGRHAAQLESIASSLVRGRFAAAAEAVGPA